MRFAVKLLKINLKFLKKTEKRGLKRGQKSTKFRSFFEKNLEIYWLQIPLFFIFFPNRKVKNP